MDAMMSTTYAWLENPVKSKVQSPGVNNTLDSESQSLTTRRRNTYKALINMLNQHYFISRNCTVPDTPSLFDDHIWPMNLNDLFDTYSALLVILLLLCLLSLILEYLILNSCYGLKYK